MLKILAALAVMLACALAPGAAAAQTPVVDDSGGLLIYLDGMEEPAGPDDELVVSGGEAEGARAEVVQEDVGEHGFEGWNGLVFALYAVAGGALMLGVGWWRFRGRGVGGDSN